MKTSVLRPNTRSTTAAEPGCGGATRTSVLVMPPVTGVTAREEASSPRQQGSRRTHRDAAEGWNPGDNASSASSKCGGGGCINAEDRLAAAAGTCSSSGTKRARLVDGGRACARHFRCAACPL